MPTTHTLILLQLAVQALEEANRWTMTYHQRDLDQQRRNSDFHRKSDLVIQTNRCTPGRRKIWIAIELKEKLKKNQGYEDAEDRNQYKVKIKRKELRQHKPGVYNLLLNAHFLWSCIYNTIKERLRSKRTEYSRLCDIQVHIFVFS